MSESCGHNCSSCGEECSSRTKPKSFIENTNEFSNIKKVIAVVSGKGGVGKSLVTSMLAAESARRGYKTAILDADITGPSIPKAFGLTERAMGSDQGIYPVLTQCGIRVMSLNLLLKSENEPAVWRGPMIAGAVKQFWTDVVWGDIDYMFIDMPPGTGDVPLTVFQSIPVDGVVIITTPQELVSMIVSKAVKMADMMNIPIYGLVENMSYAVCPDCGKRIDIFGKSHVAEMADKYGIKTTSAIPFDANIASACDNGLIETIGSEFILPIAERCFTRI